ncbi:hypothetical protein BGZ83_004101, partial [Gryganskiella cystojenkinii]
MPRNQKNDAASATNNKTNRKAITRSMAKVSTPNEDATKITATTPKPTKAKTKTKTTIKTNPKAITTKGSKSKVPYRKEDYDVIHGWLASKINFQSVFGHSGQTPVGGLRSPQKAWEELADLLRIRSKNRLRVDGRAVKERFVRYKQKYMEAKAAARKTGFGVTEKDRNKGIFT